MMPLVVVLARLLALGVLLGDYLAVGETVGCCGLMGRIGCPSGEDDTLDKEYVPLQLWLYEHGQLRNVARYDI